MAQEVRQRHNVVSSSSKPVVPEVCRKEEEEHTMLPQCLVVGAFTNAWCLYATMGLQNVPREILVSAQVFIFVCGYRCLFPNRYNGNVVLRDTWLSNVFLTRFLATFSEVFWLHQLSILARDLNQIRPGGPLIWIDACAWIMVFLVCFAQCCVWSSFIFETEVLMWYEEFNWTLMFIINTAINIWFFLSGDIHSDDPRWSCVWLSLVFGAIYLPFQILGHLPYISKVDKEEKEENKKVNGNKKKVDISWRQAKNGLWRSLTYRKQSTSAADWGHTVGAVWMFGYWILEPFWLLYVAYTYSSYSN